MNSAYFSFNYGLCCLSALFVASAGLTLFTTNIVASLRVNWAFFGVCKVVRRDLVYRFTSDPTR
jgi:hypothetical protein